MSSRILELSSIISQGAADISHHLQSNDLPFPSFEPGAPHSLPKDLSKIQDAVLDAADELKELLTNPLNAIHAYGNAQPMVTLDAIQRFDMPNLFEPGARSTFSQIASKTGLSESVTKSLLRHAVTMRIFCEPEKGFIAHTSRSVLLRESIYKTFLHVGINEMTPAALRTIDAVSRWPLSEEPSQTGFCLANKTDVPMYKTLEQEPKRAQRFADTMSIFTSGRGFEVQHVIDGFQWKDETIRTVVDVGGSNGHIATAVAKCFPDIGIVVQDLESTVSGAADSLPEDLSGRLRFMAHDFFQPQEVVADLYFFRWIFHNWSDKYCLQILRALIPALRPGARVLINDICMPDPGTVPLWTERKLRTLDLDMLSILNGRERDADDWNQLVTRADPRFHVVRIRQPPDSSLAMIEITWKDD